MATLKQRLNMKTADGYSTVHLETSSDLVQRDDGTSVEDSLTTLTKNVTNLSTSVENVTNNITTEVKTIIQEGNAAHAETHATGGSDEITPDSIGALSVTGTAESAKKLETARTFQVNLGSTSSAGFDGTGNVTPGVTGTLGVSNGGTGKTTEPLALYNLINGCNNITSDSIVDTDVIPIGDTSAATGKSVTIEELKTLFGSSSGTTASISNIPTTPGETCDWAGYNWTVVHVTDDLIYMITTNILSFVQFSSSSTVYKGSTIANLCLSFQFSLGTEYLELLSDVTINGVMAKAFIASYAQASSDFTWLAASISNRIAKYNSTARWWWLSTAYNSSRVYYVNTYGEIGYGSTDSDGNVVYTASNGFRPCVAVKRT